MASSTLSRRSVMSLFLALGVGWPARSAHGRRLPGLAELDDAERDELADGALVSRPMRLPVKGGYVVGGVSYQRVHVPSPVLLGMLQQPENLPELLPFTLSAKKLAGGDRDAVIAIEQGRGPLVGRYAVRAMRQGEYIRFWLDRSRPAPFQDLWGYFRAEPFVDGDSLLTVAVLLDLGPGMMRWLFESKIQRIALSTPRKIRDSVEPQALAQRD